MLKFGNISEIDAAKGLARVQFDDDDIVSGWIPAIVKKTTGAKENYPFEPKEHVACLMDEHCENGVIVGAIYSKSEAPALTSKDKFGIKYDNGDEEVYDRAAQTKHTKVGNAEHTMTNAGHSIKTATDSLYTILNDLLTQLQAETHPDPQGAVTGPPVNAAAYAAIAVRLATVLQA